MIGTVYISNGIHKPISIERIDTPREEKQAMTEPSTKPLITALMLALGRSAELYDACRKDGQTNTILFETVKHTHYVLSGIIEDYPDAPEDSRPILDAYETVIQGCRGWAGEMDFPGDVTNEYRDALAVLGVTE